MSAEQRLSSDWHQILAKMENKIRVEESLANQQREVSAISLRKKERECDSLREQMKRVIEMGQRLTTQRDNAIEHNNKLQKEMNELCDKNVRLERRVRALETELRPENRQKRVEDIRKKVVASLQLSADTEPLSVFANHGRGVPKPGHKYAITVQNPLLDKSHTFYQFNPNSLSSDLYKAVCDQFGVTNFELASLVYNKIDTHSSGRSRKLNVGDRTLAQNNLYHDMHVFIIDADISPKPGQLFHVMMGRVTNSEVFSSNKDAVFSGNNPQSVRKNEEQNRAENSRAFQSNSAVDSKVGPQRTSNLNRELQRSLKPYSNASNIGYRNRELESLKISQKPYESTGNNQRIDPKLIDPKLLDTQMALSRSLNPFQDNDYRTESANVYPTRKTIIYQ